MREPAVVARVRNIAVFGAILLLSLLLPSEAFAQAILPLPPQVNVDERGVDLVTGAFIIATTPLSIGTASNGLSLTLYSPASGAGWLHSQIGTISSISGGVRVSIGGASWDFTQSGTIYAPVDGGGDTLVAGVGSTFTFTAADGTVASFSSFNQSATHGRYAYAIGAITSLKSPNGLTLTYTYQTVVSCDNPVGGSCPAGSSYIRLQSVNTNTGYQLKFQYSYDFPGPGVMPTAQLLIWQKIANVTALNNTVDYCDPSANSCTYSQSWPTLQFPTALNVTDPAGHTTTYTAGTYGITSIQWPSSSSPNVSIVYDTSGRVQTYTLATPSGSQTWTYGYVDSGTTRTTTLTEPDAGHHTRVITSDLTIFEPTSIKNELGYTTTYAHNTYGHITRINYPETNHIVYVYGYRENIGQVQFWDKSGSFAATIILKADYDASCANPVKCNQPNWVQDGNGHQTSYGYDGTTGLLTSITQPVPGTGAVCPTPLTASPICPQVRYSYSALQAYYKNSAGSIVASGQPILELTHSSACRSSNSCTGTADENVTTISFGPQTAGVANNLLPVSIARGAGDLSLTATTAIAYDTIGNRYTATDPLSHVTRYRYDLDRNMVGVVGPNPTSGTLKYRAERITYNVDGLVTLDEVGTVLSQSDPDWVNFVTLQQIATGYDSADRKVQDAFQAAGTTFNLTNYSYDAINQLQCTAVRMSPTYFSSAPAACTLGTEQTSPDYGPDRITYSAYDAAGQLLSSTSGYGTASARADYTFTYNPNGTTATVKDANLNVTNYGYDGIDRLSTTTYPNPLGSDVETLTYDLANNVLTRSLRRSSPSAITYGYDAINRLISKTLPTGTGNPNASFTYDLLGEPLTANNSSSAFSTGTSWGWDALGRKLSETSTYNGAGTLTKTMLYDLAGRRTRLTWPDAFYVTYDYDGIDEMTAIHENGGTVIAGFTYDDLGNRLTRTAPNGSGATYGYDGASRLTSLQITGALSPNTITLAGYNPADEIGSRTNSATTWSYTGGANGTASYSVNSLNQYGTSPAGTISYDNKGNVAAIGSNAYTFGAENTLTTGGGSSFWHDGLQRLVYITSTALRFDHDDDQMIGIYNSSNTLLRRFVFGPNQDEPLVWYEGTGTSDRRQLDADERGSVSRVTSVTGSTMAVNTYDEYGQPGSGNLGRFGYTGQIYLSEIGMNDFKARIYAPALGRFMQPDPIGYAGGINLYNYALANPIDLVDRFGLDGDPTTQPEPPTITIRGRRYICPVCLWLRYVITGAGQVSGVLSGGGGNPGEVVITAKRAPKHCFGPPSGPKGVTSDEMANQARQNGNKAAQISPANLKWFYNQVRNKAVWDYKQYDRGFQDFGNYNYGYAGTRQGIPQEVLLEFAGFAQLAAGTSSWDFAFSNWDDPVDQAQIKRGASDARNGC